MNLPKPVFLANDNDSEFWRRGAERLHDLVLEMQREGQRILKDNQRLLEVNAELTDQLQDAALRVKAAEARAEMLASANRTLTTDLDLLKNEPVLHGSTVCELINDLAAPFRATRAWLRRRRRNHFQAIVPVGAL